MRVVPTRQIQRRAKAGTQPADLFVPAQREAPNHEPDPTPPRPAAGAARVRAKPPSVRPNGLLLVAVVAVVLSGLLGVVTVGTFSEPEPDRAAIQYVPSGAPAQPFDGAGEATDAERADPDEGTDDVGITVGTLEAGTSVSLPGPASRDWVAPGARSDGSLVRADLAEESIEFRAANTQPGLPGAFRLSWRGGTAQDERGDATTMLGVRPGGWVAFVVRPLTSPADLVLHLSGNDVAVTIDKDDGSSSRILSAPAAVVTVALPAGTAAAVTVMPAGDQVIGVATADLR